MRNKSFNNNHLKFLIPALLLVFAIDQFVLGTPSYIKVAREESYATFAGTGTEIMETSVPAERELSEAEFLSFKSAIPAEPAEQEQALRVAYGPQEAYGPRHSGKPVHAKWKMPQWQKNAIPFTGDPAKPKIVIVIDDLGVSRGHSKEIIDLGGPLTLAFLPYAENLGPLVDEAKANGHELMVHMPMEPMNGELDMGGIFLSTEETPAEFHDMLIKGLTAFEGYVGINNHMGSKLTQDKDAMQRVMEELRRRGLLFLDSRTISTSVGAETAAIYNVPYAKRDVFLDDDVSLENVRRQLEKTERVAREYGIAIAIGHPKPNTIEGLKEWLPTLEEKGFVLAPVSSVVKVKAPDAVSAAQDQAPVQPHP